MVNLSLRQTDYLWTANISQTESDITAVFWRPYLDLYRDFLQILATRLRRVIIVKVHVRVTLAVEEFTEFATTFGRQTLFNVKDGDSFLHDSIGLSIVINSERKNKSC